MTLTRLFCCLSVRSNATRRLSVQQFVIFWCLSVPLHAVANDIELLSNQYDVGDSTNLEQVAEVEIAPQFSTPERKRIMGWLEGAMEGLRRVYGEWPQQRVRIRVEASNRALKSGSPVPWGQVIRGRGSQPDEVYLQLNLQSNRNLVKDWTVYHELSHTLIPYQGGARWLSEGLASYYQNIVQARLGLLTEQQMWQKLLDGFERGAAQNAGDWRTLQQVSDGAGQYMRIHWHGVLYWLTVDTTLRRESGNQRSLDGALKALKRCCETLSMRPRALVRALDKAYKTTVFSQNYDEFRNARSLPDFKSLLGSIGLPVDRGRVDLKQSKSANSHPVSRGIYLGEAIHTSPLPDLSAIRRVSGVGAAAWSAVENGVTLDTDADGFYSNAKRQKVGANSLIRVGSISKTLLATGALRMAEQKQLNLDHSLSMVAPDVPLTNRWPQYPVSLRMLLEHSAGLADLSSVEMNHANALPLKQALALAPDNRVTLWPAGFHSSYSNAGAGLLSRAIEHSVPGGFDNWFDHHMQSALGMPASTVQWSAALQRRLVAGYDSDLKSRLPYWHTLFRGFGGVNSTALDMSEFLKLFTNQGRSRGLPILSPHSLDDMRTPKTTLKARAGVLHGRALGVRNIQFMGNWLVSHNGDADGYLSRFAYAPATSRAYFVVINAYRDDLLKQFVQPLDRWLLAGAEPRTPAPIVPLSAVEVSEVVGEYQEVTKRFTGSNPPRTLVVSFVNGTVRWRFAKTHPSHKGFVLQPVGNHTYRSQRQFAASSALVRGPDGALYLQGTFGNFRKIEPLEKAVPGASS